MDNGTRKTSGARKKPRYQRLSPAEITRRLLDSRRPTFHALFFTAAALTAVPLTAAEPTTDPAVIEERDFAQCVAELKQAALAADISPATVNGVMDQVEQVERVLELDRAQPEFTQTFADYFNRRVTEDRVSRGRELLERHRLLLEQIRSLTGVPPQYLVSFWGLETNFGGYLGKMAIPDSLTTLACDERRSRYFTGELISALRIIDSGDIAAADMNGSWAGAMGHVQFMPSAYLRYAVDHDGDGRRDLFNSTEDALASAGNFLAALGWQSGLRWGREVLLPENFDFELAWTGEARTLGAWRELGITDAFGTPLPEAPVEAVLRVPAGHKGPAFLTYQNFDVIMRWNRSVNYALSVGHLADRIAGGGRLHRPPPEDDLRFTTDDLKAIQFTLEALGFEPGVPDGRLGPNTRAAVSRFQAQQGLIPDGHLTQEVVDAILSAGTGAD